METVGRAEKHVRCLLRLQHAMQHRPLLIFIQHYVFNIKDSQSIPNLVKQIKSSVDKISVV